MSDLFEYADTRPRSRQTDPETSVEAGEKVVGVTTTQRQVLAMVSQAGPYGITDYFIELHGHKKFGERAPGHYRKRRSELLGACKLRAKVDEAGNVEVRRNPRGRKEVIWVLSE